MTIKAISADGVVHEFAAGTPDTVIDKVMRDYAAKSAPNPYEDTARAEMKAEKERLGFSRSGGGRQFLQGLTMGGADEALAVLGTPVQMIKRGTLNPLEGYRHAKAREDVELERIREESGAIGTAGEIAGSVVTGTGIARAGLTAFRPGMGAAGKFAAGTLEGAAQGAVQGGLEAKDGKRLQGAGQGAAVGGAVGGAATTVLPLAAGVVSPLTSQIRARVNPRAAAERQVARGVMETGRSADDIANALDGATADGQGGVYTLADEMGNPGQRLLSTVARTPGQGRTQAIEFLDPRQADQTRRVQNTLDDGFATQGMTAKQAEEQLLSERSAVSNQNYTTARNMASLPVDVQPVMREAEQFVAPQTPRGGSDTDKLLEVIAGKLHSADGQPLTDFSTLLRSKQELDAVIETAQRNGDSNTVRVAVPLVRQLDEQLAQASRAYDNARDMHRAMSLPLDALEEGKTAATKGRFEDHQDTFRGLGSRDAQQGFRVGYADELQSKISKKSEAADKTLPLRNSFVRQGLDEFAAPGRGPQMSRRLAREQRMSETYGQARQGSRTADNQADEAALATDPSIALDVATGNGTGVVRNLVSRISAASKGLTPEVREHVAQILLQTPQSPTPERIAEVIRRVTAAEASRQSVGQALIRGAAAGAASGESRTRR